MTKFLLKNTVYFMSDNELDGIENATHTTFTLLKLKCPAFKMLNLYQLVAYDNICTEGVMCMIFTRGAVCSPKVLQSTEGKNHSLPRSIYLLFFSLLVIKSSVIGER
jgi:hypothetical protein